MMAELEKYKGYQLSVNRVGQFEASLDGEVCLRSETMKAIKEQVDRAAKKAFKPFTAWIKKSRSYYSNDDVLGYKKVTVSSVSPLTGKVYHKDGQGSTDQDRPDDVYQDTPENIKQMDEVSRLDKEVDALNKNLRAAEEKIKRINVKPWLGKNE